MAFMEIFHIRKLKERIETLEKETVELYRRCELAETERDKFKSIMTDENGDVLTVEAAIASLEREQEAIAKQIQSDRANVEILQRAIKEKNDALQRLSDEIVELEDEKLLQEFGLYKPMYSFATSCEYKEKLDLIRSKQKQMIRDKVAAICPTEWTVNGSRRAGMKMTNDNIKQVILTFNIECENAIGRVTFSNYESMKKRITSAFDKLNKLNETNNVHISVEYYNLKLQELALAYEYAQKKQEEKEMLREQREIQREQAKVEKEIEAERKRIQKEQAHYQNVLARLLEQIEQEPEDERRALLLGKVEDAKGNLADLDVALQEVDYREANQRAGYVYVISNIGAFGEDVYKIGMTRRLNPQDRIDELSGAAVPFKFDVHAMIFSSDAPKLETALHNAFSDKRVNSVNTRKEFFRVSLKEIEEVVRRNHDNTADFIYLPEAQQYRESMKMTVAQNDE